VAARPGSDTTRADVARQMTTVPRTSVPSTPPAPRQR
jgi:hypothetical protein